MKNLLLLLQSPYTINGNQEISDFLIKIQESLKADTKVNTINWFVITRNCLHPYNILKTIK